jgi:uncharacterized Rossmann fold enzyme
MKVAFVCVNVGPRYGKEYVAILRDMVLRNASRLDHACAFFCLTDRPDELPKGVYAIPAKPSLPGYWQKVALFAPDMPWEPGTRVVYFDLDVCITGRLEDLVERRGIARDAGWPCFNSSVMIWDHGEHREVWDRFTPEIMSRSPGPIVPAHLLPGNAPNGGDQEWLSELGGWDLLPSDWVQSYRWQATRWPPTRCRVVQFHGDPKPHEIVEGWVPNVWKIGGFTSFPEFKGANTSEDQRLANVASAAARDLPWFTGFRDEGSTCVIVGGAPSLKDSLSDIRWHARQKKTRVIALNNAWRILVENGIMPNAAVLVDARPENAEFVKGSPVKMRWLVSSQCHPEVFDALGARDAVVWHSAQPDNAQLMEILKPWWGDGPDQKPTVLVPGGSTVALRTIWLAAFSGFRKIHMYGVDSSYAVDGSHHAYAQGLNEGETVLEVARGAKRYSCAAWMVRQAAEFEETWRDMAEYCDPITGAPAPVTIHVHGTGLIPDIARTLRERARERAA